MKRLETILKRLNMTIKLIQDLPFSSKERLKLKQDADYYKEQLKQAV